MIFLELAIDFSGTEKTVGSGYFFLVEATFLTTFLIFGDFTSLTISSSLIVGVEVGVTGVKRLNILSSLMFMASNWLLL